MSTPEPARSGPPAVARWNPPLWEQHCCLPLQPSASIAELARYPVGAYLSVNVGYSPQSTARATAIAESFRRQARADGRFVLVDEPDAGAADRYTLAFDLEDSGPLGGDLDNVAAFYALGVRTLLPSYNYANAAACGCLDANDTGLSRYGRELVAELNRVGMVPDGSHCSIRTGLDLASASTAPMIYSHANFRAVHDHPRNITDDQARACAATGGVIGVNGVGIFLGVNDPSAGRARVEAMADQVEYGVDLVGIDHIGIGSDYSFDAADFNAEMAANPGAFSAAYTAWGPLHWVPPEDVTTLPAVLRQRGFDAAAIDAISRGNFRRVAALSWR